MILTVNANAAIDRVLFINSLDPRGTIRAARSVDCVGGKGADTALALNRLGAPHKMVGFNAGAYGRILEDLYLRYGIQSLPVWVEGETRTVTVIIETDTGKMTQISHPGYRVTPQDCERLLAVVEAEATAAVATAAGAGWCVAAGSLPAGAPVELYRQVCERAHRAGARVMIDTSGAALTSTLDERPDLVKLNRDEFAATFACDSTSIEAIITRARALIELHGAGAFVVTLGEAGILMVRPTTCLLARGPRLEAVNPAGAGDAASAALAYRLSLSGAGAVATEDADADALRWACACGAAVVRTEATADFSLETAQSLLPDVDVSPVAIQGRF